MPKQSTAVKQSRVAMVCSTCGSEDVTLDALAAWDVKNQRWKLAGTLDYAHCNTCGCECRINDIPKHLYAP